MKKQSSIWGRPESIDKITNTYRKIIVNGKRMIGRMFTDLLSKKSTKDLQEFLIK